MIRVHHFVWLLSFTSTFALAAPPAAFPSDLQPMEIAAPAIRYDVRTICPSIDAQLQRTLGAALAREQRAGSMRVDFRVDGDHVSKVSFRGAPWEYRRDIRSAVSRLTCVDPSVRTQHVSFELAFVDEGDDRAVAQRYAVLVKLLP